MASGICARRWFIYGRKILFLLLVLIFLLNSTGAYSRPGLAAEYELGLHVINADQQTPEKLYSQYLPVILKSPLPAAPPPTPIALGIYPQGWPGTDGMPEAHAIDAWAGKGLSIVGTFIDIEDISKDADVTGQLTTIWQNGYTPFVNLMTHHSAQDIIDNNTLNSELRKWARAFNSFTNGGERMAFIAPLPEMNGDWVPYFAGPQTFKNAYWHIQSIFSQEGVPEQSVRWVFAPNGPTYKKDNFEYYYPGDATVDVVGFSSYNYGCHPNYPADQWLGGQVTFKKYLVRMTAMAPSKPIFITQTGTTAYVCPESLQHAEKDNWLIVAYTYLETYPGLRAIIYFNKSVQPEYYDWPFWSFTSHYDGYQVGVSDPAYRYISPADMKNVIP